MEGSEKGRLKPQAVSWGPTIPGQRQLPPLRTLCFPKAAEATSFLSTSKVFSPGLSAAEQQRQKPFE